MLDRKEEKRREHRRKKYKFALVELRTWYEEKPTYQVERKDVLKYYLGQPKVICDDQPEYVLRGMLKLLKEE